MAGTDAPDATVSLANDDVEDEDEDDEEVEEEEENVDEEEDVVVGVCTDIADGEADFCAANWS